MRQFTNSRFLLLVITVLLHVQLIAQVGINEDASNPDPSAMLDVKSINKGLLIPRMTESQRAAIPSPATGLMIYQTDNTIGFYFYNGSAWNPVTPSLSHLWSVNGNAGTSASTHFIGTTDNQPLVFKVNNLRAGMLDEDNVYFGTGSASNSTPGARKNIAIGSNALKNNIESSVPTGSENVAIGSDAMFENIDGYYNVGIGVEAMRQVEYSFLNVALGYKALRRLALSDGNVAIGANAMYNFYNGNSNTAIGIGSLFNLVNGVDVTGLGAGTEVTPSGLTNATAVGAYSKVECSNCLVLGAIPSVNSPNRSTRVGIGTTMPNSSSVLDLTSTTKGFLTPRMTEAQRNAIVSPATGLLVYQTTGSTGFYSFNGVSWSGLAERSNTWSLNGNTNTNAANNFIGTVDNKPLIFKVNSQVSAKLDANSDNTSFGYEALQNQSSFANTAVGYQSLKSNTSGQQNTALGKGSLETNTSGYYNTAVGGGSLGSNETGLHNTAVGSAAMYSNVSGNYNTVLGSFTNVGASNNHNATAIGAQAMADCSNCLVLGSVNGINNAINSVRVGVGTTNPDQSSALEITSTNKGLLIPRMSQTQRNSINTPATGLMIFQTDNNPGFYYYNGSAWTIIGGNSQNVWSTSGNSGTNPASNFIGTTDNSPLIFKIANHLAGKIDPATTNTAFGNYANLNATTTQNNTAFGSFSLMRNTQGVNNTAVGTISLLNNTLGTNNTAIGVAALANNISGNDNISIGTSGLNSNNSGNANIAVGNMTLFSNVNGNANVALGASALFFNSSGIQNTAIGNQSLNVNTTGSLNTAIGFGADVNNDNLVNATAIGSNAIVTASNKVRIGNSSVTVIEGQVPFTSLSDGRFKYNIQEDVKGLEFIMKLRPVTYQFDAKKLDQQMNPAGFKHAAADMDKSYDASASIRRTGFIAQEVEKAANESAFNFSGINKPSNPKDHYGLSYESFVVPLVKAVQEQQKQIEELKKENEELKQLKLQVEKLAKAVETLSANK